MTIVDKAIEFAKTRHAGQFRRDGKPYFTHLEAVAKITEESLKKYDPNQYFNWNEVVASAYLHDWVEMGGDFTEIHLDFGYTVSRTISILTRESGVNYFDYIMGIEGGGDQIAKIIKIADLTHNLNDGLNEGSMKDKYRFAKYILEKSL